MEGSPSEYFEASKEDQRKYINQLLALVRRYSERPEFSDDERLRWSQARYAAAIVARSAGHMNIETFDVEFGYYTSWIAWAVGGVSFTAESPPSCVQDRNDFAPQKEGTSQSTEIKSIGERVRELQELNRKRLYEHKTPDTEPKNSKQ